MTSPSDHSRSPRGSDSRVLVHLDADAFFASVEQAADPRLRGRAIAVGGEKRGIIASASYEARRYGVYTPMPTVRARKLCPNLIVLPGDFEKYERFSRWMFSYAYEFTPDVEITSIDEGYFDLSGARRSPSEIAQTIRRAIGQSLRLSVSEGIGSNKLVSQIASKLHKPAAFAEIPAGSEIPFLHPLPNRWLPGVGPQTASRLNAAGLARIGQIAQTPAEMLHLLLGRWAVTLREFANGIDERPLIPACAPAQSYGQQETFASDQTDEAFIEATLRRMADQLMAKVRADGKSIRTLTVKVRYNDMDEDQRGESLPEPTALETDLYPRLRVLLRQAWKRRVSLRLVSLKLSGIYHNLFHGQLSLRENASLTRDPALHHRLAAAIDELRHQRGASVVMRGHDLLLREPGNGKREEPGKNEPARQASASARPLSRRRLPTAFPLAVHSYYSFLDSTLSIDALIELARVHRLPSLALTDQGNLHGAVEFAQKTKAAGIRPVFGAELRVRGRPLWLYVQNAAGYHHLCRLLSRRAGGHQQLASPAHRAGSPHPGSHPRPAGGASVLASQAFSETEGLLAVSPDPSLARLFPGRFYLAIGSPASLRHLDNPDRLPLAAVRPVHYGVPADQWKYHVIQSIRTLTLLGQEHPGKRLTGSFHFPSGAAMAALFGDHPELLRRTHEIADRCDFELPLGPPQFPAFAPPDGSTPRAFLRRLVFEGLGRRYPQPTSKLRAQVEEELGIIHDVGYEEYFLVVWDILQECRRRGIDWITRGSAADSLVCYCLGISGVCPIRFDLYFRRFLNKERMALHKLPDIDVDFAHDRKDDVVDLVFERYGPEHAAVVGGFSTFQARSAFAEIAKVLGVAERQVRRFTEHFPWSLGGLDREKPGSRKEEPQARGVPPLRAMLAQSPDCRDLPIEEEPFRTALDLAAFLDGFPRYPKMHPCGVVLSRQPMRQLTPTFVSQKGYPTTHFDMDAVEAVGLVKIDILAQGGLAVMRDVRAGLATRGLRVDVERCQAELKEHEAHEDARASSARRLPPVSPLFQDPAVWDMIASGGARAVHHIESPAMTSLCRMCHVREIDGLIAIVSVIRPGAANELKKVDFARRYQGLEPSVYPHPSLEPCLRSTFGLVVYEEHILQISEAFAGLPPGRADVLRRALNKQQWTVVGEIGKEFVASARRRGHPDPLIAEVWELVVGFKGYAFCKAHSTAYGVEAYQAAWLKKYFPADFMAAVLTHGKGFYHPLVYVLECHRLGIPLLPPCVNRPGPAFEVEPAANPEFGTTLPPANASDLPPIRVPATRIKGLTDRTVDRLLAARARSPFQSLRDFYQRVAPLSEEMEALLRAGAFDSFGSRRTELFWELQYLRRAFGHGSHPQQGWLLPPHGDTLHPAKATKTADGSAPGFPALLSEPTRRERLQWEADLFGFPVSGHPLALHEDIAWDTYCPVTRLGEHQGETVVTCGLVIEQRLHHQMTGEPMKFLTLADWTGMVETELFASTYRSYGLATVRYPVLEVTATVEPFDNRHGFTLRVHRAGPPRTLSMEL